MNKISEIRSPTLAKCWTSLFFEHYQIFCKRLKLLVHHHTDVSESSAESGLNEIGGVTTSITYSFIVDDFKFNSKVSKVVTKNRAVLNMSKYLFGLY